jgi:methylthioribose-1-phosphate isomerase
MDEKRDLPTLYWKDGRLYMLDQRLLPKETRFRSCSTCSEVIDSISNMVVRGAPAIGISASFGLALAAREAMAKGYGPAQMRRHLQNEGAKMRQARPTAVNLTWAIDRVGKWLREHQDASEKDIVEGLVQEALLIHEEDLINNHLIGKHGADLLPQKCSVLTHCNAGALATGGYGTALGVIRAAVEQGKDIHVYVDETRPLLQGSRITAFELTDEGIAATLVTDNCAGHLMALGKVDLVVVGADRIAGNGDAANKIGTYSLAVLADYHKIPFYVAAPLSTIDLKIASGSDIIIEERCCSEVTHLHGICLAPEGMSAFNPAFDITPAKLISAIITEKGVIQRPDGQKIMDLFNL